MKKYGQKSRVIKVQFLGEFMILTTDPIGIRVFNELQI